MLITATKKHPCPDCHHCQWCNDERCRLCLRSTTQPRLSIREQIALYERLNSHCRCVRMEDNEPEPPPQNAIV